MENTAQKFQELQNKFSLQEQQIEELTAMVNLYEEQYRLSQKRRYGSLSERIDENQLQIFNEAEAESKPSEPEPTLEEITYRRRKQKGKRDEQLKDLPVVNCCPGPKACRPSAGSEKKVMKYPPLRMWVLFSAYQ